MSTEHDIGVGMSNEADPSSEQNISPHIIPFKNEIGGQMINKKEQGPCITCFFFILLIL